MPVLVLFLVIGFLFVIMGALSVSAVIAETRQHSRENAAAIQHDAVAK